MHALDSDGPVWGLLALLVLLPVLGGCDDGTLNAPDPQNDTFQSYVALGNSITAGFQSAGIVDSTQQASYASLLADQMGTPFGLPSLSAPGCPPPVANILLSSIRRDSGNPPCGLRSSPLPPTLHNVAVPNAKVIDALTNDTTRGASPNALTSFILGGRTQVQAAAQANPTFASVWLGNNDALGAALAGRTALLTPTDAFRRQLTRVVDSLVGAGADRGVLIGVANPTFIPNLSPGRAYFAAEDRINELGRAVVAQSSRFDNWGGFVADSSCASGPGAATRVPFAYFGSDLLTPALLGFESELVCDPSSAPAPLLTGPEQQTITTRVRAYNRIIATLAEENGWAYVNVNSALGALYAAGTNTPQDPSDDLVPKLPRAPTNFQTPAANPPTFGRYFSEDGVHPSSTTHRVVAQLVIQALNRQYDDVELEPVSIPDEVASLLQQ